MYRRFGAPSASVVGRHAAFSSVALERAMSLTRPSIDHPATAPKAGEKLEDSDPRVCWREYWDFAKHRPYYHNLITNEVVPNPPQGMPTRFGKHWVSQGYDVDHDGKIQETTPEVADTHKAKKGLKGKLAVYGAGGLLLYLIVHNICLAIIFGALYIFNVDLISVAKEYGLGLSKEDKKEATKKTFVGTFITAVALNKMLVPLQLLTTLGMAPFLAARLTPAANTAMAHVTRMRKSVGF